MVIHLRYVFPCIKLASGQSHAKEKLTVRTVSGGTLTEAAMAAPMEDPGSEGTDIFAGFRWSKDPC